MDKVWNSNYQKVRVIENHNILDWSMCILHSRGSGSGAFIVDDSSSPPYELTVLYVFRLTFDFSPCKFTRFSKPPSRDKHRKASYPMTQQRDQGAGWTQIMLSRSSGSSDATESSSKNHQIFREKPSDYIKTTKSGFSATFQEKHSWTGWIGLNTFFF